MIPAYERLLAGEQPCILVGQDDVPGKMILLPGSFNPLHKGHKGLLLAAEKISGRVGVLELSIANVDKPTLSMAEVERRLQQMQGVYSVALTCAPTFAEKAELFPGAWFAMGYDTAVRLLSPEYHDDVPTMLKRFQELGTRFAVAGRLGKDGFKTVEKLAIPAGFEALFVPIPPEAFREDISSTELRKKSL